MPLLIWVIDDDNIYRTLVSHQLKKYGGDYEVEFFANAKAALASLTDSTGPNPDVILLDLNMPTISGWDFLTEFENWQNEDSSAKQISVFIVTSSIDERDLHKSRQFSSVRKFFCKPLGENEIKEVF